MARPARRASTGNCRRRSSYEGAADLVVIGLPRRHRRARQVGDRRRRPPSRRRRETTSAATARASRRSRAARCGRCGGGSSRRELPSITISPPCDPRRDAREPARAENGQQPFPQAHDHHEVAERRGGNRNDSVTAISPSIATTLNCRKLNTATTETRGSGTALTQIATAAPRIATADSLARRMVPARHRQRLENRGVARIDRQRVPLRRRHQRRDDHRQRQDRRTCR